SLVLTALLIWVEGFYALRKNPIPETPGAPYPPATAVIAAYLPNEGATIVDTIEAFLRLDYPAPLQIILAYNSPYEMPIERDLKEIAARDPRFVPFRVSNSTSKAQNINTVIAKVTGEFIGIFDADHHPDADSFTRAWRWLSNGYSIVQGHCAVRNGDSSWVSRLVAVEFEAIYAISHPGRARLHQFGIFGGSNGFWKVDLLRQTRMHGFMLTEDIDSSIRVTMDGVKIASDPDLISRELAPTNLKTLWNQRMRWAQGWHQVSLKHLLQALASKKLTIRQKFGAFWLLGWREAYPWLSMQMFPIILFWIQKYHGVENINWLIPIFVMATLFTLSVGPGQVFFSYRLSLPEIKQHKGWFVFYFIFTSLIYTEFKNTIGRVAQIKELFKERQWKVTPRSAPQPPQGQSRFVSR
ncbi:MAG TPA: glycosyltransferase, partial [Anaerolineales bacterium]|nr:glycosyltransferase [Anaerolineales bacterium]